MLRYNLIGQKFEENKNIHVYILVIRSKAMHYGGGNLKREREGKEKSERETYKQKHIESGEKG